jgi:mono/diheme cytochrome c family protein
MTTLGRVAVAAVIPLLLLAGCKRSQGKLPGDPVLDAIRAEERAGNLSYAESQGRHLFVQYCVTCHGDEAKGDGQNASNLNPPPPDMTASKNMQDATYLEKMISDGSAGMGRAPLSPPWGRSLSRRQIADLVAYCQALNRPRPYHP